MCVFTKKNVILSYAYIKPFIMSAQCVFSLKTMQSVTWHYKVFKQNKSHIPQLLAHVLLLSEKCLIFLCGE